MDYALLQVGINKYPGAPLNGCVNDCRNLLKRFGNVGQSPIWTKQLFDKDATRARIIEGLQWLVNADSPVLIFQYSGHGTRVRDTNGDESSRYDSAIVPVDYPDEGVILDDALAAIYDRVPPSKRLIVLSDSCFSGKSQRSFTLKVKAFFRQSVPRFLPVAAASDAQMVHDERNWPLDGVRLTTRKSFLENNERCVLISTSKETQTSADAYVNNQWQGAGTAALLWAWQQVGITASYLQAAQMANTWLKGNGYEQVLRVEGKPENRSRALFT